MVLNCETNTINMEGMKRSSDELSVLEFSSKRKKIDNDGLFKENSFQDLLKNYNIDLEDSGILYGSIDRFFKDSISRWSMEIPNCEMESIINQELNKILQHISFKQYFRHNLEIYCNFIRIILTKISSPKEVVLFLQNDLVFYRTLISEKEFQKQFLGIIFPELVNILSKYDDQELYLKVCWIFKKVILDKNSGEFQNYLDTILKLTENKSDEKFDIPKSLLKTLGKTHNSHVESYPASKIIFQSIINAYKDFKLIFKFCIAIVELLGLDLSCDFNCKKFSKFSSSDVKLSNSLVVLSKILEILKNSKIDLNCSVVINFSQFIENIVKSILNLTKIPNEACYKILEYCIEIHPLLVEKYLNNLLSYSMFAENTDCEESYLKFLLKIFETYAKLHRIQNLISKMLPVLKSIEENKDYEEYYTFRGNNDLQGIMERRLDAEKVLPDDVLYIFSQYATQMASWQYMNLFKTFIFHLDATVNDFIDSSENTHNSFIELLCKFTSWLLRINRMDENTTTPKIMENFNASMGEVKNILKKLGGALLEREHDQLLVRVFLNLSYDWADRHIQFHYYNTGYLNDEGIFSDVNHPNYQYSFLTNEQWILLSQRIMNFGESNSKHLMLLLVVQKLSAMYIFENKMDENCQREAIDQITSNVEGGCEYIVTEKFINEHLIHKLDLDIIMNICDELLTIAEKTPSILKRIIDSKIIHDALSYILLKKISKVVSKGKSLLKKLFSIGDKEMYILNSIDDDKYFEMLKEVYEQNLWSSIENCCEDNADKLRSYSNLLMELPIPYLSPKVKSMVLLGLFSLHKLFWGIGNEYKTTLETWIKNLMKEIKIDLMQLFEPVSLVKNLISNFVKKDEFLCVLSENVFKNEKSFGDFIPAINYLLENSDNAENLQYSLLILKDLKKVKKSKSSAEFKELCSVIRLKILNVNFDAVTTRKADPLLISSYVSCLKHWIVTKEEDKLEKLVENNEKYLNMVLEMHTDVLPKGSVLLFSTVLLHKQVFEISPKLPLKIWTYCKLKKVDSGEVEDFSQLLCLIFEHIPNDKFELISSDIFNVMVEAINSESYSQLFEHLRTGTFLLNSSLNPVKFEIWLKFLERLMFKLHTLKANLSLDQEVLNEIIKFEVAVINRKLLILSPSIMSMLLMSPFTLMKKESNYYQNFNLAMNYMESLLKHRSTMIMDRISAYLKVFRRLLFSLCKKCGEIEINNDLSELENITNCAYQLEKLVGHLVMFKKDMGRIAPHLIADILYQYETYTLFPKVKVHLNNCMYSLVSVCDNHAVSYLLRGLSSASTELFKIVFNEYKKFHRFTGKV